MSGGGARDPEVPGAAPGAVFSARNIDPAAANAIHDDDVARSLGFSGALVPGVELFARATTPFVARHGEGWLRGGRLALRFRRPVYDGEQVTVEHDGDALALRGPDGEARAVGSAGHGPVPAVEVPAAAPLRDPAPPAVPESLPPGPMGTVRDVVDRDRSAWYLSVVEEPLPLYREVVHPGLLLRAVNLALSRNVALGPWIHTSSDAVLLAAARLPAALEVRAVATGLSTTRQGHDVVRYDAVVLADGLPVMAVDHTAVFRLAT